MANFSDDRKRLIEDKMRRNGGDRVMAELETRTPAEIRAAGCITLTGGLGGVWARADEIQREKQKTMRQIEVMQVGSPVTLSEDIQARITGVMIEENYHITYRCVWWEGGTRNVEWLEQFEVTQADEPQGMTIGFQ